ncbi:MAG TPA: hypothetical protein VF733_06045 [Candidatus Saccharimonadales bacterium]
MADPAEAAQPLSIEYELVRITERRSDSHAEVWGDGLQYPEHLGPLAVDRVRFDPDYDVYNITQSVKADFLASYGMADGETANAIRQRSMAWLDWLAQGTNLNINDFVYLNLATIAAKQGDAETVRQIVEDPRRLWFDRHAGVPVTDPTFGRLDRLSVASIGAKVSEMARLMAVAPEDDAERVRATVMPTFRNVVTEFVGRDLTNEGHPIEWASRELLRVGTPDTIEQVNKLVAAMPMTAAKLDTLVKLAYNDERYATAAAEAIVWQQEKASLAEQVLAEYLKPYGTARNRIDYPINLGGREDPVASQPIAAAIVDRIPKDSGETSAIETSVAYLNSTMFGGSVHGNVLGCVRTLTGNPHFEFADPQFGFAARFEDGESSYAHGKVTVVDANLPDGRVVIDLSGEPFWRSVAHDDVRFLCRIIQTEKNRRVPAPDGQL